MAKYTGADCRLCRREGCKLFLKGDRCMSTKCSFDKRPNIPGQQGNSGARRRVSEYGIQFREKQKVKRAYNLQEKQFYKYYEMADKANGITGEVMLSIIEKRFDNVVYRLGFADSRAQARQLVNHSNFVLNGKKCNIPSLQVKVGDVIEVKENCKDKAIFKELAGVKVVAPKWLETDMAALKGKVIAEPMRDDIDLSIKEHLIVELYSK